MSCTRSDAARKEKNLRRLTVPTFFLVLLALALTGSAALAKEVHSAPELSAIDRYIRDEMELNQIPGLSLAIVQSDRLPVTRAYGVKDLSTREAMTAVTPVDLASVSKSLTGLAVAQLIEVGQVELDAPVRQYLPGFRAGGEDATTPITVRHLLEHRSGLTRWADYLVPCCVGSNGHDFSAALRALGTAKLQPGPPADFRYANSNYIVLAALVESVAGQPFASYMQTHVFEPLDMPRTTLDRAQAEEWGLASYHEQQWGRVERSPSEFTGWLGSSGVKSTAEDMARYIEVMLDGVSSGSAPGRAFGPAARVRRSLSEVSGDGGYRFGWFIAPQADWLEGARVWGHSGDIWGANSAVVLAPDHDVGVAVLINMGVHRARDIARGVLAQTLGLPAGAAARTPWQQVPDNLAMLAAGGSVVMLLLLAVHWVRVRREFRAGARRFRVRVGWTQVARGLLLGGMAVYLVVRVFGGGRPFAAYPTTMRVAVPLITSAMTALLALSAVLSFAPRRKG